MKTGKESSYHVTVCEQCQMVLPLIVLGSVAGFVSGILGLTKSLPTLGYPLNRKSWNRSASLILGAGLISRGATEY